MKITISRFDPLRDREPRLETFDVPVQKDDTVLGALNHIYDAMDSSLAHRYGCRFNACGLCAIRINGRARLACTTRVEDGMELAPLHHFAVVRDLVVDRRPLSKFYAKHRLHLVPAEAEKVQDVFEINPSMKELAGCLECLACLSDCPAFDPENMDAFGGPLTFVKLAQLHFDPRDTLDRRAQARDLGVSTCQDCKTKCGCVVGVPIHKAAIKSLM